MTMKLFGRLTSRNPYKSLILTRSVITNAHLLRKKIKVQNEYLPTDSMTNVPRNIVRLLDKQLHNDPKHPIGITRSIVEKSLDGQGFTTYDNFSPVTSTYENFDILGFPSDHPGRSPNDTYYINKSTVLRTHTSAHELECFKKCETPGFLISADVYRRDTIDKTHFSAFHQMEGARLWHRLPGNKHIEQMKKDIEAIPDSGLIIEDKNGAFSPTNPKQESMQDIEVQLVSQHLKKTVELIMGNIFSKAKQAAIEANVEDPDLFQPIKARWNEDEFPWTGPSYEIEIWWKGKWLEMCGCGVVQKHLLSKADRADDIGWAFGIGLDRTAMLLFGIPDIRMFWSQDKRFLDQFQPEKVSIFKPYSKYPSTYRDIAFWAPLDKRGAVHINEVADIVREYGEGLVENIELIDKYKHPRTEEESQCYRITYQAMDRNLTNEEVNEIQSRIRFQIALRLHVDIR